MIFFCLIVIGLIIWWGFRRQWIGSNNWTGIEAIVSFVLNISIIYITFYIHRKEREERIAELEKQQKQIDEQRHEADFDRQALMLQNRINLLAEREEKLSNYLKKDGFFNKWFKSSVELSCALRFKELYDKFGYDVRGLTYEIRVAVKNIIQECDNTISLLEDVKSYSKKSGRQDLYYYTKLNIKFYNYCNLLLREVDWKSDYHGLESCNNVCKNLISNIDKYNINNPNSRIKNIHYIYVLSKSLTKAGHMIVKLDKLYQEITESN